MATATTPATTSGGAEKNRLKGILEGSKDRLAAVLPKHIKPEHMVQVALTAVYRTPKLQECDPVSILGAVMQAAELGLELNPSLGEAYLIPRWNNKSRTTECQFQPGYQGLRKLALQTGEVVYLQAREVCEKDEFEVAYLPELSFTHKPAFGDRGPITHVYAMAKLKSGEFMVEVMTRSEVETIRTRSQSADNGPWVTDWMMMARKTVLKRLCKSLPRSPELARAIEHDNTEYEKPVQTTATLRGTAALEHRLGLDEPALPPQGSKLYSEADDVPPAGQAADEDEPGSDG